MIPNHDQFLQAIQEKKKVWVKFYSQADHGVLEHVCAPLEYGPGAGVQDGLNRYWLWDYMTNTSSHSLGLLPQQIVELKGLGDIFDPAQFATGPPPLVDAKNHIPPLAAVNLPAERPGVKP